MTESWNESEISFQKVRDREIDLLDASIIDEKGLNSKFHNHLANIVINRRDYKGCDQQLLEVP